VLITPSSDSGKLTLASQLSTAQNVALPTGLQPNGSAAIDDGPALTAFAQLGAAKLVLDGASLSSGLFLASAGDVEVEGLGDCSGIFQVSGSNNTAIQNSAPGAKPVYDVGPGAVAHSRRVALKNFYLNAKGAAVSTRGDPHTTPGMNGCSSGGSWAMAIHLMNLNDVLLRDLTVFHSPTYNVLLRNIGRTLVDGCKFLGLSSYAQQNHDAVHLDGTFDEATVVNSRFEYINDDCVAVNLPEGNAGNGGSVLIRGNTFVNCWSIVRAYTSSTFTLGSLKIADNIGSFTSCPVILGLWNGGSDVGVPGVANALGVVTVENNDVSSSRFAAISNNTQALHFVNNVWRLTGAAGNMCDLVAASGQTCTVGELRIDGITVLDTGSFGPVPYLITLANSTITHLVIDSVDPTNISALTNNFAAIGTISGAGVLSTGWAIPDANMAKWTPYVSASSGLPSYKNGAGTVVTL